MKSLYLIDGMSLVFRAYHAMSRAGMKSPSNEPTGAVFGFINLLLSFFDKESPEYIAVVFDTSHPTFRHEMYPLYKANRDAFPEELVPQLGRIKQLLNLLSVKQIEKPGFEADDVIGTLSKLASDNGIDVKCMTSDKDFYQLVGEHVRLLKPGKAGADFETVDTLAVFEKFGVTPSRVIDVLALTGDTADNIPGVKGVGEKSAIPLIAQYGSVENLYENIDKIDKASLKTKLIENRENAFLSKKLATIMLEAPVDFEIESFKKSNPKFAELDNFCAELGFNQIRKRFRDMAQKSELNDSINNSPDFVQADFENELSDDSIVNEADSHQTNQQTSPQIKTIEDISRNYRLIDTIGELDKVVEKLKDYKVLALDLETSSLDRLNCEIVGISMSAVEGEAFYIPVAGLAKGSQPLPEIEPAQDSLFGSFKKEKHAEIESSENEIPYGFLPVYDVLQICNHLFTSENIGKCGQNIKFDTFILKRYGVDVTPVIFDSMLASYILNPDSRHNLDVLSQKWLGYEPIPITSLIGEKKRGGAQGGGQLSMKELKPSQISDYACEDADLALKLKNILEKEIEKEKLTDLLKTECALIEVLTEVEHNGVAIDTAALGEISKQITIDISRLTQEIFAEAGTAFNIDSPKQLASILFEKLGLPADKKTKTGYSTDVQVLTQLAPAFPIANLLLEYRQLVKLKSTYVDVLPTLINPSTGRIHTTFNQTIASTGRLSSTDPNLQNIPIRTDLGKEIRKAFVAQKPGWLLLSADYSQIELRIMAYISKDDTLINAFKNGLDIHTATAAALFDLPLEEVTSDNRRVAKTVNFGIMYGLGSFGLSQRLNLGRREAQEIITSYFNKYPGIKRYIDETIASTREKGYAESLCGRRRYFADIASNNRNLRTAAERAAINMPIQGTAADMLKIAMINIHKEMKKRKLDSIMTLQVHDELIFETPANECEELRQLVITEMENALPLGSVPVIADTGTGANWFDAH